MRVFEETDAELDRLERVATKTLGPLTMDDQIALERVRQLSWRTEQALKAQREADTQAMMQAWRQRDAREAEQHRRLRIMHEAEMANLQQCEHEWGDAGGGMQICALCEGQRIHDSDIL